MPPDDGRPDTSAQGQAVPTELDFLALRTASLHAWVPQRRYDLVTCVHGLHYIGDKLSLLGRAIAALEPHGVFIANLDLRTILFNGAKVPDCRLLRSLRSSGLTVDPRRHLVSCTGPRSLSGGWHYLGVTAGLDRIGWAVRNGSGRTSSVRSAPSTASR
jgi:hypothetical protein